MQLSTAEQSERGRQRAVRCNGHMHVDCETDASGSELQLLARYGQNACVMALGRGNWLFAGSLRAANIMSLIQSAKLNGHDPYVYFKGILQRLPTQPSSRLEELLPHHWMSSAGRTGSL